MNHATATTPPEVSNLVRAHATARDGWVPSTLDSGWLMRLASCTPDTDYPAWAVLESAVRVLARRANFVPSGLAALNYQSHLYWETQRRSGRVLLSGADLPENLLNPGRLLLLDADRFVHKGHVTVALWGKDALQFGAFRRRVSRRGLEWLLPHNLPTYWLKRMCAAYPAAPLSVNPRPDISALFCLAYAVSLLKGTADPQPAAAGSVICAYQSKLADALSARLDHAEPEQRWTLGDALSIESCSQAA